jgi:hypothetical protein
MENYQASYSHLPSKALRMMLAFSTQTVGDARRWEVIRDILSYRKEHKITYKFRIGRNRYVDKLL